MDICQEALCPTFAGMNKAQMESESELTPEEDELQLQLSQSSSSSPLLESEELLLSAFSPSSLFPSDLREA